MFETAEAKVSLHETQCGEVEHKAFSVINQENKNSSSHEKTSYESSPLCFIYFIMLYLTASEKSKILNILCAHVNAPRLTVPTVKPLWSFLQSGATQWQVRRLQLCNLLENSFPSTCMNILPYWSNMSLRSLVALSC